MRRHAVRFLVSSRTRSLLPAQRRGAGRPCQLHLPGRLLILFAGGAGCVCRIAQYCRAPPLFERSVAQNRAIDPPPPAAPRHNPATGGRPRCASGVWPVSSDWPSNREVRIRAAPALSPPQPVAPRAPGPRPGWVADGVPPAKAAPPRLSSPRVRAAAPCATEHTAPVPAARRPPG